MNPSPALELLRSPSEKSQEAGTNRMKPFACTVEPSHPPQSDQSCVHGHETQVILVITCSIRVVFRFGV